MTTIRELIKNGKLKVGDVILYYSTGKHCCTCGNPFLSQVTLFSAIKETKWVVHKILENSIQIIPCEEAIHGELELFSIEGVIYGPEVLDQICNDLWTNEKYGAAARSIRLEDFEGFNPNEYPDEKYIFYTTKHKKKSIKDVEGYQAVLYRDTDRPMSAFYSIDYLDGRELTKKGKELDIWPSVDVMNGTRVTCNSSKKIWVKSLNYEGHCFWIANERQICSGEQSQPNEGLRHCKVDYGICFYRKNLTHLGNTLIDIQYLKTSKGKDDYQAARYDLMPIVEIPQDVKGKIDAYGFWFKE